MLRADFRVFISYRRIDGRKIADQLFDALTRRNFDVFLDRFRIDPGLNVQEKIFEELAHKSMIVLIETATSQQSPWVAQEIACAVSNRLGILGLLMPNGVPWPYIPAARRVRVKNLNAKGNLPPKTLHRVCRRIALAHGAAMMRRRLYSGKP